MRTYFEDYTLTTRSTRSLTKTYLQNYTGIRNIYAVRTEAQETQDDDGAPPSN